MKPYRAGFAALVVALILVANAAYPAEEAAATEKIRVACVGDSITRGQGAPGDQSYPAQLGKLLGEDHVVANYGVGGAMVLKKSIRPYVRLKEYKAALGSKPNVVVIMLGTNDGRTGVFKEKDPFLADYRAIVKSFVDLPNKPKVILCKPIPVIDNGHPIRSKTVKEDITSVIEEVAKEMNLTLADCYTPLAGKLELIPDKIHPNGDGYKIIAETVVAAIKAADKAEPPAAPETKPEPAPTDAAPVLLER